MKFKILILPLLLFFVGCTRQNELYYSAKSTQDILLPKLEKNISIEINDNFKNDDFIFEIYPLLKKELVSKGYNISKNASTLLKIDLVEFRKIKEFNDIKDTFFMIIVGNSARKNRENSDSISKKYKLEDNNAIITYLIISRVEITVNSKSYKTKIIAEVRESSLEINRGVRLLEKEIVRKIVGLF